jgi:hypothetical protein
VNAAKRAVEFAGDLGEAGLQRRRPADQDVIVARAQGALGHKPNCLAQTPPQPVALHRAPDLLRDRESDARRSGFGALSRLQQEGPSRRSQALGGGPKIRPAFQALHVIIDVMIEITAMARSVGSGNTGVPITR